MPDFLKKLPDGGSGTSLAQETVGVADFNRVVGVLNGTDGPVGAAFANPLATFPNEVTIQHDTYREFLRDHSDYPRNTTLLAGQEDEVPSVVNCTATPDLTNFKIGIQGWLMTMAGAVTAQMIFNNPGPVQPFVPGAMQSIGAWIFFTNASQVTSLSISMYSDAGLTLEWTRNIFGYITPVNGWNFVRIPAPDGNLTGWGTIWRLRIVLVSNAATTVTIGHIYGEAKEKATLVYIADGPYQQFLNGYLGQSGYPDLAARRIPVQFAVDPGALGTGAGISTRMTAAQLASVAGVNGNDIGFHGWDGSATTGMTAAQVRTDTMKAIKWLEAAGYYTGHRWRVWVQNLATNAAAVNSLLLMYYSATASTGINAWPPTNQYNIPRMAIQGTPLATLTGYFTTLQQTKGMLTLYAHAVDPSGGNWCTPAEWANFLASVDAAIAGGWLEFCTIEQLFARTGIEHRHTFGDSTTIYFDASGVQQTTRLP